MVFNTGRVFVRDVKAEYSTSDESNMFHTCGAIIESVVF